MRTDHTFLGIIKRHPDGFGFFISDNPEQPDIYVPKHSMKGAMTNDRVSVRATRGRGSDRVSGEIVQILKRATTKVVGSFLQINDSTAVIRDEGGWGEDLKIPLIRALNAKKNDLVLVKIESYPDSHQGFTGSVEKVLGPAADPLMDIHRVVHNLQIPSEFSPQALRQAASFSSEVHEKDFQGRKDLRHLHFVTIDGATAKDFDDAIFVTTKPNGFQLYVAIADVSHYVTPGSAIDKDAFERGTSVYFPNFVIPMLPEILSNELCSLKPKTPRLAMVAEMEIDFSGTIFKKTFYEAVIESKARVTYGEAQEILDGQSIDRFSHVQQDLLKANDLAKILMKKRFQEGSLDLEIPEVQILLDGAGQPTDLIRSERLFAHRLIEELMLAANIAVAEFFTDRQIPGIFRVHEPPNQDAIRLLERYLWNFGSKSHLVGGSLQKKITQSLHQFENTPHAQILNILTLRSMSQAKYSSNNVGHFGLGFKNYSHFTSPIRRYPDLIAHRILKSQIYSKKYKALAEDELSSASVLLSACEQRAVKSERQFVSIKKARFMERHVGSEFEGVISSVARFGVFVLLRQYEVDGLVRIEDLSQERLQFDEEHMILRGKRTGAQFRIGDIVKIKVRDVSSMDGKINFDFVELVESAVKVESALAQNVSQFKRVDSRDRRPKNQKHRGYKNRERKQGSAANFEREPSERQQGPKKSNHPQRPSKHSDDDSKKFKDKKQDSFAKKQTGKKPKKKLQFKSNFSGGIDNLDRNTSKLKGFLRGKK